MDDHDLKHTVRDYWQAAPCNSETSAAPLYSRQYWEDIETTRYRREPEVFGFAQFCRYHGQRVLEVGVGAGTDFLQWVRAGAQAHGIDLTAAAVEYTRQRLACYGLTATELRQADCETLPFPDDHFDCVYSWGVIHHTPDTDRAFAEIARVTRPGGTVKVMLYNRHSVIVLWLWLRHALLAGRPWRSLAWVVYHHVESLGTTAYTHDEARAMCQGLGLTGVRTSSPVTWHDRNGRGPGLLTALLRRIANPDRLGWFLMIEATKPIERTQQPGTAPGL